MRFCVTDWLSDPKDATGAHFLEADWSWRRVGYDELARRVGILAGNLMDAGMARRHVALAAGEAEPFLVRFLAIESVGATAVPLVPPSALPDRSEYPDRLRRLIDATRPAALLGSASTAVDGLDVLDLSDTESNSKPLEEPLDVGADQIALIQFSSGSSGAPKPIRISRGALDATLRSIRDWLRIGDGDATGTWLPLYHDMGLVGTALTPIIAQTNLFQMNPIQFLIRPEMWLRCFAEHGCTMTAAPPVGYERLARKTTPEALRGVDLSRWRVAIVGAEPIRPRVLEAFTERFGPFGFRRSSFRPAYGMAEATLIVTGVPQGRDWRVLGGAAAGADDAAAVVSSGPALPGSRIEIRDADGRPLPEGGVGEIWVSSPHLADGYEGAWNEGFESGWYRSGDVGLLDAGELFVLGRVADSLKLRSRTLTAEHAEELVAEATDLRGPLVVVPSRGRGVGVSVVFESGDAASADGDERHAHRGEVLSGLFDGVPVDVIPVARGAIPRTTSGKVRRRECWRRFVAVTRKEVQ